VARKEKGEEIRWGRQTRFGEPLTSDRIKQNLISSLNIELTIGSFIPPERSSVIGLALVLPLINRIADARLAQGMNTPNSDTTKWNIIY
jgi:hypothetical protein